jgi:hypothetical protein
LRPDPRDQGLGRSSLGVRFFFRAGPRLGCPCSGLATRCLRNTPRPSEPGIRLPLGFLLPRARLRRVPLVALPQPHGRSGVGESRQAFTGAVLRVLAPLDGSGCACGTHGPLRARRLRAPRRFAALFHAARALWSRPTELSLLEEPYPLSRASCFLAGSRSTRPMARHGPRCSRPLSPIAPTTRHGWPCGSPD